MSKTRLICIVGKSAAGKDSVLQQLYSMYKDYCNILIHDTTRPQRFNENTNDFINYYFINELTYWDNVDAHKYLVHHEFRGWGYGLYKSQLQKNKLNIGIFNPYEVEFLLKNHADEYDIQIIYITCSLKERISRMKQRGTNKIECMRRLLNDYKDFKKFKCNYEEIDNSYQTVFWTAYRAVCLIWAKN